MLLQLQLEYADRPSAVVFSLVLTAVSILGRLFSHAAASAVLTALLLAASPVVAGQTRVSNPTLRIELPTDNEALFEGDGPAFYQYTDRVIRPGVAPPWTGGKYGFVRNIHVVRGNVIYSRFHEGVDIRPLRRSSSGEPLDEVRSIDDGVVAYVNRRASTSSYGHYVVIEHWWGGAPYYSLYAHLANLDVDIGQAVARGEKIGQLGYTGVGINRRRAHVHLEINLLVNQSFQAWYDTHYSNHVPNYHGIFNGRNLLGLDVSELFLGLRQDSLLTIPEFLSRQEPFFEVTVPGGEMLDILWRYPWLSPELDSWSYLFGPVPEPGASWIISFARSGLPLHIESTEEPVDEPQVLVLKQTTIPYQYLTNGLVRGTGSNYSLSASGRRLIDLITRPSPDWRDPSF